MRNFKRDIAKSLRKIVCEQALRSDYEEIALKLQIGMIDSDMAKKMITNSEMGFRNLMAEIYRDY